MQRVRALAEHVVGSPAGEAAVVAVADELPQVEDAAAHRPTLARARAVITTASVADGLVTVEFGDDSSYRFHAMWLRDSCTDPTNVQPSFERNVRDIRFCTPPCCVAFSPSPVHTAACR